MSGAGAYYKSLYGGGGRGRYGGRQRGRSDRSEFHQRGNRYDNADESRRNVSQTGGCDLELELQHLEGSPYPAYKSLLGCWKVGDFDIYIDHIQADPYAPPSRFRVRIPQSIAAIPHHLFSTGIRNVALCDYLARVFDRTAHPVVGVEANEQGWHGQKGGAIRIDAPNQFVLQRSCVSLSKDFVEGRFTVSLPAHGRTIEGRKAANLVCRKLPDLLKDSFYFSSLDGKDIEAHVKCVEDQDHLRKQLAALGLVAFVGNDAILPRVSGVDDRPMEKKKVISFKSPPSMEVSVTLPNKGVIWGMGIKRGVTLLVGGGFHGKSTLLEALQVGVYNKIPDDGREYVVTDPNAVKIRAEDGRYVCDVDISCFLKDLPLGTDTSHFTSKDASGSTSQAANVMEALEIGATALLLDEDTSATNFMIRDERMRALVADDKEPITCFRHKVRQLYTGMDVSTIIVVGGSGDYFDVADSVIQLDTYTAVDVTAQAKQIAQKFAADRENRPSICNVEASSFGDFRRRHLPSGKDACIEPEGRRGKSRAIGTRSIQYGNEEIDLAVLEQIIDGSQTRAIACCLIRISQYLHGGSLTVSEALDRLERDYLCFDVDKNPNNGLDNLSIEKYPMGAYAIPRRFEIAGALNRLRSMRMGGE